MSARRTIHLATDHAGFAHKEAVKEWLLKSADYEVFDHGAKSFEPLDDFPDYIRLAVSAVSTNPESCLAIIFGGSGQGEAMVANRFPRVRATVYYGSNPEIIELSRAHNDANVLSIGARFVSLEETKEVITKWLMAEVLTDEKYQRRNKKIETITREIHAI
ncbi:MAG: RpiB/LacA/LacB family sugar-phosphate isomerase [Candidatus Paceibacterota bacterium]